MVRIDWQLKDIFPTFTGSLTATLKELCQSDTVKSSEVEASVNRLKPFTAADKAQSISSGSTVFWRRLLASDLLKLVNLVGQRAVALSKTLSPRSKQADKLWLLSNCRPAGGNWQASNLPGNPRNPTGKPCLSWLCPWCWMRRFDDMRLIMAQPYEAPTALCDGRMTKGIGLPVTVNVTTFTVWACGGPEAAEKMLQSETLDRLLDFATDAVSHKYVPEGGLLKQAKVPEFQRSMRILCPIFVRGNNENAYGWKVSYVHDAPFAPDDPLTYAVSGIHATRIKGLTLSEALHKVYQFPIDLLHAETPAATIFKFLEILEGRRHFTCKEFKTKIQPCAVVDFSI